jgi:hypothetical protein
MIRDPSDGSVREPQKSAPGFQASQNIAERGPSVKPDSTGAGAIPSGLPPTTDPKEIEKLSKSKEWLNNYHKQGQPT